MASKKAVALAESLLEEELPTSSEIEVEDFIEEWAPHTTVVEIYQMMKDGSKHHQERVGIEILKSDLYGYIRENYPGGGKFQLQFKNSGRRVIKNLTINVGAGPKAAQAVAPNGKPPENDFTKELLIALIANQKGPDVGTMMAGLGTLIGALKPAGGPDMAAMLGAMAATFQSLRPKETDGLSQFKEMVTLTKELMPVPKEPIEENMYTVIKEIGNKAVDVFSGGARPPLQSASMIRPAPVMIEKVNPIADASTAAIKEKTQQEIFADWIKAQLTYLKTRARAMKDVGLYIDSILINDDEPANKAIIAAIENGATFEQLLKFDSEINEDPGLLNWFKQLYDGLYTEIHKNMDTSGAGGNLATLNHMRQLAQADSRQAEVRELAYQLRGPLEIDSWLRQNWRIVPDPLEAEFIQSPALALRCNRLFGDCDDAATLAASLLRSLAWPCLLVAIRLPRDPEFSHVFTRCFVEDWQLDIDPIVPAHLLPIRNIAEKMEVQV